MYAFPGRGAARSDAPQTRDRRKMPSLKRSRISGAPFHAAPRPGNGNLKLVAMSPQRERDELSFVSPQVAAELGAWLAQIGGERKYLTKYVEADRRDVVQFLGFLAQHLGGSPSLKALASLAPADVRAFLAARRAQGVGSRSLMRTLAGLRGFARSLESARERKT